MNIPIIFVYTKDFGIGKKVINHFKNKLENLFFKDKKEKFHFINVNSKEENDEDEDGKKIL